MHCNLYRNKRLLGPCRLAFLIKLKRWFKIVYLEKLVFGIGFYLHDHFFRVCKFSLVFI